MKRVLTSRDNRPGRRGAALVEGAFVLSVLVIVLFSLFDMTLFVIRENSLGEGARRLARAACTRGSKSVPLQTAWGPATVSTTASTQTEQTNLARPVLVAMDARRVSVRLEWPDGRNDSGSRVRVTLSYLHQPIVPFLTGTRTIEGVETLRIAH
jgi:Flp pilus assembly protein TadG